MGIHVTFIIPKCSRMNWINVEEASTVRVLVHCIILFIIIISLILFQNILLYFHFFFNLDIRFLYAFGITVGLISIFGNFLFSHLISLGFPVIETTLTSLQTSRRFES